MDGFGLARVLGDFMFGFGTLFAIINPYGLAFVFLARTVGLSEAERALIARRVALYAFGVLVVSLFAGSTILGFFGISLPALRVAGGLVVAASGWAMLHEPPRDPSSRASSSSSLEAVRAMAFSPLTVPLTTGPGTIAAAIALGANRGGELRGLLLSSVVSLLVAAAVTLTILHAYRHAGAMSRLFGEEGTNVVTRLSAFLLLCVGVEIALAGGSDALRASFAPAR
jgi:multiple antibiotic resistance protein